MVGHWTGLQTIITLSNNWNFLLHFIGASRYLNLLVRPSSEVQGVAIGQLRKVLDGLLLCKYLFLARRGLQQKAKL